MAYTGEQKREYQRVWVANRRAEYFNGKTCNECSSDENLELHHREPVFKVSHNIWSWSKEKRIQELVKCDVLCNVCHLKKTKMFLTRPLKHGTDYCYNVGCRCEPCRLYKSIKNSKRIRE